jgi:hypothetical protein
MTITVGIASAIVSARRDDRNGAVADVSFLRRAVRSVGECGPEGSDSAAPERS